MKHWHRPCPPACLVARPLPSWLSDGHCPAAYCLFIHCPAAHPLPAARPLVTLRTPATHPLLTAQPPAYPQAARPRSVAKALTACLPAAQPLAHATTALPLPSRPLPSYLPACKSPMRCLASYCPLPSHLFAICYPVVCVPTRPADACQPPAKRPPATRPLPRRPPATLILPSHPPATHPLPSYPSAARPPASHLNGTHFPAPCQPPSHCPAACQPPAHCPAAYQPPVSHPPATRVRATVFSQACRWPTVRFEHAYLIRMLLAKGLPTHAENVFQCLLFWASSHVCLMLPYSLETEPTDDMQRISPPGSAPEVMAASS